MWHLPNLSRWLIILCNILVHHKYSPAVSNFGGHIYCFINIPHIVVGCWKFTFEGHMNSQTVVFILPHTGEKSTGSKKAIGQDRITLPTFIVLQFLLVSLQKWSCFLQLCCSLGFENFSTINSCWFIHGRYVKSWKILQLANKRKFSQCSIGILFATDLLSVMIS